MLTLASAIEPARDDRPAYRPFRVRVRAVARLSPSFLRVTFAGDELAGFGTAGLDQRIKLVLPLEGAGAPAGFDHLGICEPDVVAEGSWYERWRRLPEALRNPVRTYTVRAIRQDERELDVDFVVHGDGGPASRWVSTARAGDELVIVGPDDRSTGWRIGLDWHPGDCDEVLLVGDETAVPAIGAILESLGPEVHATAFLEVPGAGDLLDTDSGCAHTVTWLPRAGGERGTALIAAVREWAGRNRRLLAAQPDEDGPAGSPRELDETDAAAGLVWDSPAAPEQAGCYAWIAGETQTVVALRRHLVRELGVDRRRVAFMGYWRQGRAELG